MLAKYRVPFLFAIVIGISLALRIVDLGVAGYWIDEMSSIHFASNEGWNALLWDNSPPTYHAMLKGWIYLFGTAEAATRSLSVVFSVMTTMLWLYYGYRRVGLWGGVLAGLLHSIFAFAIYFGRETRMYSLFELTSTFFLLSTYWESRSRAEKIKSYLSAFFIAISHYLSVVPLLGWSAVNVLFNNNRKRSLIIFGSTTVLCFLFIAVVRLDSLQWQVAKYQIEENSRHPGSMLLELLGSWAGAMAMLGMLLFLLWKSRRVGSRLAVYFFTPIIFAWIASTYFERSVFMPRYFIFLSPIAILFVLLAFQESLKYSQKIKIGFLFLVVVLFVGQAQESLKKIAKVNPPWKEAAILLNSNAPLKVFTSRPLSLQTPYFNENEVTFVKIVKGDASPFQVVFDAARSGESTWLLENYWGFQMIKDAFIAKALENNCGVYDYTQKNESIEMIHVFNIRCD